MLKSDLAAIDSPGFLSPKWFRRHIDVILISVILLVAGFVSAVNMSSYPQRFEDEGTYISQAWAIQKNGTLTHYTYWYDHPPLGWVQMATHLMLTGADDRYESATSAGREFMLLLHLVSVALIYGIARRLGFGQIAATIGTLAYGLSPLVVEFSRYIMLDNVALPWLLGALYLALSPKKHIATAVLCAVFMSVAVLSKETFLLLLPVVVYAIWQFGDKRNRRFCLSVFIITFVLICGFYVLYAILKNELFPGPGHVSLLGTAYWQVFGREGSGSVLSASSGSRGLLKYWLNIDHWLLLAGLAALPFAFFFKQVRVVALGFAIGILLMLRTGYLPYPYIISLLPFAALVIAGVLHHAVVVPLRTNTFRINSIAVRSTALALTLAAIFFVVPSWVNKISALTQVDQDESSRQAVQWIAENIPRDSRMVVESALWTDLQNEGFNEPDPVWLYKTETDPAVVSEIDGWRGIDYVILNGPTVGANNFDSTFPTVNEAIINSELMTEFGKDNQKILVFKVNN